MKTPPKYRRMTNPETVYASWVLRHGVKMGLDGDAVTFDAPEGVMTEKRLEYLKTHKAAFVAILSRIDANGVYHREGGGAYIFTPVGLIPYGGPGDGTVEEWAERARIKRPGI